MRRRIGGDDHDIDRFVLKAFMVIVRDFLGTVFLLKDSCPVEIQIADIIDHNVLFIIDIRDMSLSHMSAADQRDMVRFVHHDSFYSPCTASRPHEEGGAYLHN
jgi:hypothetical protein